MNRQGSFPWSEVVGISAGQDIHPEAGSVDCVYAWVYARQEPQGELVVFAAARRGRVWDEVYGSCDRVQNSRYNQLVPLASPSVRRQDIPPNLAKAIRQMKILRGLLSSYQRGCAELCELVGHQPTSIPFRPTGELQNTGEVAFGLMLHAQILQNDTQALANELRAAAGMESVGPTVVQSQFETVWTRVLDTAKADVEKNGWPSRLVALRQKESLSESEG